LTGSVVVTAEDVERTAQYRGRAQAAQLLENAASLGAYLLSLEMVATVKEADEASLPRIAQLVAKTNQFNLTGRRRSIEELRTVVADPASLVLAVRLSDRFVDHGLVGVLIAVEDGPALTIDTWLLSCRVIGRTLEDEMLILAEEHARVRGLPRLRGSYVSSPRNSLVADLLPRMGFVLNSSAEGEGSGEWVLETGTSERERTAEQVILVRMESGETP